MKKPASSNRPCLRSDIYGKRMFFIDKKDDKSGFNWSLLTTIIGLCITAASLFFTSKNIKETEKWKKAEFIAAQFEKFSNDTSSIFVSNFLDYFSRNVQNGSKSISINKDLAGFCLLPDSLSEDVNQGVKIRIRNNFDNYLDRLSLFNRYYKSNVVTYEDIKPYLEYQIRIIASPSSEEHLKEFQIALWDYINRFGFTDVQELCCLFGYNITPDKAIVCKGVDDSGSKQPVYIEGFIKDQSQVIANQQEISLVSTAPSTYKANFTYTVRRLSSEEQKRDSVNTYEFKLYITVGLGELQKVQSVTYHLHPTFANQDVVVSNPKGGFALLVKAWGQFDASATVSYKDGTIIKLNKYLNF